MKKLLTVLFVITSIGWVYSQPWVEQTSGVTVQLTGVSAIDPSNTWVCGYSGTVLRTTNGGINWLNVSGNGIPSTIQLINVFGINNTTALVAGYISTNTWVYRTTNAGANWTQVFTQTGGFINAVHIRLDNTGFMMGDPVGSRWSLWKTTNSGANWDSTGLYLPQAGSETGYNNCLSVAINRIWFGTTNARVYNTTNNGANWVIQTVAPETQITAIWFDENGSATGYCGGNTIMKTTDYGTSWISIGGPGTGAIVGIASLPMWGGNLWYVRSGSPSIYFGYGTGFFLTQYTAPAGTYRHVTTDRIPNYPFIGYAVRNNGGISYTQVFVENIKNLGGKVPENYSLHQNFPNPFNPATKIRFDIPSNVKREAACPDCSGSNVMLNIFNTLGQEIAALVNEDLKPGTYEVEWDASNYPSGVYYYKLQAGSYAETKKMIFVK